MDSQTHAAFAVRMIDLPFDVESLIQPLADDAPGGPDLEYDPRFTALEQLGAGKPERQYGDTVYPAEPPEWRTVYEQAMALAPMTRDLRIGVWVLRSATQLHGLAGATAGLKLLSGLLVNLWDSVHPQLDASDNDDPTMRLSALAPLASGDSVLADLRNAALTPVRGSLRLRELELALANAAPAPDEPVPTEAGVMQGLQALLEQYPDLTELSQQAQDAVRLLISTLDDKVPNNPFIDLAPLRKLLRPLDTAIGKLGNPAGGESRESGEGDNGGAAGSLGPLARVGAVATGAIASRADVIRELERVCDWIERHEPTNPAPILIRRAQRLMNKSFLEIIRDLAPDGVSQIENLAGPEGLS